MTMNVFIDIRKQYACVYNTTAIRDCPSRKCHRNSEFHVAYFMTDSSIKIKYLDRKRPEYIINVYSLHVSWNILAVGKFIGQG